jgi:xeroderma pigmentosum group C-complementing protein
MSHQPARPPAKLPKNWPPNLTYLARPLYTNLAPAQRRQLQDQPTSGPPLSEIPPTTPFGPCPHVEIRPITEPAHPANGQRGLFAARALAPGQFICAYLGAYHPGSGPLAARHARSDYDLWLDRAADVAVDAAREGNEARFVNDFRGTPGPGRANAEFREVWDPRRGERGMAVFVIGRAKAKAGGGKGAGIAKGEEILVSYGKGFWEVREREAEKKKKKAAAADREAHGGSGGAPAAEPGSGDAAGVVEALGDLRLEEKRSRGKKVVSR